MIIPPIFVHSCMPPCALEHHRSNLCHKKQKGNYCVIVQLLYSLGLAMLHYLATEIIWLTPSLSWAHLIIPDPSKKQAEEPIYKSQMYFIHCDSFPQNHIQIKLMLEMNDYCFDVSEVSVSAVTISFFKSNSYKINLAIYYLKNRMHLEQTDDLGGLADVFWVVKDTWKHSKSWSWKLWQIIVY